MSQDTKKVIYSMIKVSKYYDKKPVLKDISLSYFYGAKIGVLGLNGAGKSSLLRIMAGVDTEYNGETILSDGYTVGYLEQEPLVDVDKTVREVVAEGVQETVDLLKEFEAIIAAVIGGCLLTGGYGSVAGVFVGTLTFAIVNKGIDFTAIDRNWSNLIIGVMLLIAVGMNESFRKMALNYVGGKKTKA